MSTEPPLERRRGPAGWASAEKGSYLDHAAGTPMRPSALAAMLPYLTEHHGNPSGSHVIARSARQAVEQARETVASALGTSPGEIVFVGSGTEADHLAVNGAMAGRDSWVCSAIEHPAVINARRGAVTAPVDAHGRVDVDALAELVVPGTHLVSVMLANNETGACQPLADVATAVRERAPGCLVHTDAVQAPVWLDVAAEAGPADLVALSAHKFGGPQGVGVLVVRERAGLAAVMPGGGQERGRRGGTHNVAGIVGTAVALAEAAAQRDATVERVSRLRDLLGDGLVSAIPDAEQICAGGPRLAGHCHLFVPGVEAEVLLLLMDREGVWASAGASCSSGASEPSHVLRAMGWTAGDAESAIRLTLGATTTDTDVERALEVIPKAVAHLRG